MFHLALPSIGTMTLDVSSFIGAHPGLVNELGGHALAHALYSYVRHSGRGGNRRQMRKLSNMKRRWFVDNIIMHHRRIHERNREIVVGNVRSMVLAKRDAIKKQPPHLQKSLVNGQNEQTRWRDAATNLKQKGMEIRGRVDARRLRARSRWLSLAEEKSS